MDTDMYSIMLMSNTRNTAIRNNYRKENEQKDYIITLQNIIIQQQNQIALKDQQIKNLMTMLQEERERNS